MAGKLHFKCQFSSQQLSHIGLPVEVRKSDLVLVKTGLTTQPMELDPGTYYVTAKLPAGQELYGQATIKDSDTTVVLAPEPGDESPHEWQAEQHYFITPRSVLKTTALEKPDAGGVGGGRITRGESRRDAAKGSLPGGRFLFWLRQDKTKKSTVRLRLYSGNVLRGESESRGTSHWQAKSDKGTVHILINGSTKPQFVQLLQPGLPSVNMALPVSDMNECTLVITRLPDGSVSLDALLRNPSADMLLRYVQKGFQQQAVATSDAVGAEEALRGKRRDPIAAAVGAYALLRFGELGRLHDWTENLRNWFKWLPDGSAVRGEHLARQGQHEKALDAFLELPERGLPIFSDGLSYAVTRLRLYVTAKSKFESSKVKSAHSLLEQLQKFTAFCDYQEPLTTFSGRLPKDPSNESVNEDAEGGFVVKFS